MTAIVSTISAPARCDANTTKVGVTEWAQRGLPCMTTKGLRSHLDANGVRRFYCAAPEHRANVLRRFGLQPADEWDRVAEVIEIASAPIRVFERVVVESGPGFEVTADIECAGCIRARETDLYPPHNASPRCESGGYPHCSCDRCL